MTTAATSIEQSWNDIEAINRSMQAAAGAEEWQEVLELAASRHQRLLGHFERFPVGPGYAEFYHQTLSAMLEKERELQALVRAARKRVMSESVIANQNHRAVGAYLAR